LRTFLLGRETAVGSVCVRTVLPLLAGKHFGLVPVAGDRRGSSTDIAACVVASRARPLHAELTERPAIAATPHRCRYNHLSYRCFHPHRSTLGSRRRCWRARRAKGLGRAEILFPLRTKSNFCRVAAVSSR